MAGAPSQLGNGSIINLTLQKNWNGDSLPRKSLLKGKKKFAFIRGDT